MSKMDYMEWLMKRAAEKANLEDIKTSAETSEGGTTYKMEGKFTLPDSTAKQMSDFMAWKKALRKEQQLYYPMLKFKTIDPNVMWYYFLKGYSPTDACNELMTIT